jgi:hypothetical protein
MEQINNIADKLNEHFDIEGYDEQQEKFIFSLILMIFSVLLYIGINIWNQNQ